MERKSIVGVKSYQFALKIIRVYQLLTKDKREFILSKQLMRSATSIGANVNEGLFAESKKDFIHKLHIALKETRETLYWLNLLRDSDYLEEVTFLALKGDCDQIIKILSSIILTTKQKYLSKTGKEMNTVD